MYYVYSTINSNGPTRWDSRDAQSTMAGYDRSVGVIGGGMIGTATALSLVRKGHDVTLIDPQVADRPASYGNGGALNPSSVVPVTVPGLLGKIPRMALAPDSPLFVSLRYLPRLLPWLVPYLAHCRRSEAVRISNSLAPLLNDSPGEHRALAGGTGAESYLHATDLFFVYDNQADFDADRFAWSLRTRHGIEWEVLDADTYGRIEPALADRSYFAIRLPEHGFLSDPGRYLAALTDAFRELGGHVAKDRVVDISRHGRRVAVRLAGQARLDFATAVIAAGAWSARLTAKLGLSFPLESERGYHVEFIEPSIMPTRPIMNASAKIIAAPIAGRLRCAGVVEFAGLESPANKAPAELLVKAARKMFPTLRWKQMRTWMGHRPALTDSLPIIGRAPGHENIILAFGHHHIGMATGAKTARIVADLVTGADPGIDLTPYRADRFRSTAKIGQPRARRRKVRTAAWGRGP